MLSSGILFYLSKYKSYYSCEIYKQSSEFGVKLCIICEILLFFWVSTDFATKL